MSRRLVSIRRRVRAPSLPDYHRAWANAERAARALSAHAWRFRAAADPDLFLEFLEFAADADPRSDADLAAALARLDEMGPAQGEEWDEIRGKG